MKNRLKENTWHTKEHIICTKLLPYFAKRKMNSIQPKDIIAWQNEMIKCRDKSGEAYSPVYLKTLHNQLSAIFNHAVKFYGLKDNPAAIISIQIGTTPTYLPDNTMTTGIMIHRNSWII